MKSKKQLVLVLAMIVALGLMTAQFADARGMWRWQGGYDCSNYNASEQLDEKALEARTKFHEENRELRRNMVTKKAELGALLQQDNPDETKAGKLSAEIFDLRETLHKKAVEAGLPGPRFQNAKGGGSGCQGPFAGSPQKQGCGNGPRAMWN